jgi:hypothetical protein
MSNHRKYYSEVPKLKLDFLKEGSDINNSNDIHKRIESEVPHQTQFKLATTCITDRPINSERAFLSSETDPLKDLVSPKDVKIEYKPYRHQSSKDKNDAKVSGYRKSTVFSEIKHSYMHDKNEGFPNYLLFLKDPLKKETDPEDEYATKSFFCQIKVDELVATVFIVNIILAGVIYYEIKKITDKDIKNQAYTALAMISIMSLLFSILIFNSLVAATVMKYINMMNLYRCARYISIQDNFLHTDLWKSAIFEIATTLIHPNLIAHGNFYIYPRQNYSN